VLGGWAVGGPATMRGPACDRAGSQAGMSSDSGAESAGDPAAPRKAAE
jgi:hypothetical protein